MFTTIKTLDYWGIEENEDHLTFCLSETTNANIVIYMLKVIFLAADL